MAAQTPAQEEFASILSKASAGDRPTQHAADAADYAHDAPTNERSEDDEYTQARIDAAMRMPSFSSSTALRLPPPAFDHGRTTGVKGVIADARSYEEARRSGSWLGRGKENLSSGLDGLRGNNVNKRATFLKDDGEGSASEDEEFLERWRQQRRMELMGGKEVRNRRTSPSVRRFGRFDEVDALGYLDAIEKVGREVVVVVFVYDSECAVSQIISDALTPLVSSHPAIHFVRVHYEAIEFDNAGVPAILAYKNQGDLFANLTYIIDQIPEDTPFDTRALENVLRKNSVL